MRTTEKVMFGALMTSIGIGCFQLLTSPWKLDNQDSKNENNTSTFTKGSMNNKQHNSHDIIMNSGEKQQSQVKEKSWTHM